MVAFNSIVLALSTLAIGALALPTATTNDATPALVERGPFRATHSVVAGRGGQLIFDPNNIVAEVGDVVEFHFTPKNHSVVQSSFADPCKPLAGGFFSGFFPTASGQNPEVFQIIVQDKKPIWFYCSQTVGNHCQSGMAGVVNQDFNGPNTLAAYKSKAATSGVSISPPAIIGGWRFPNPNPLSGF